MHPDLEDLRSQLTRVRADAAQLVEVLTDEQFNWRPAPGQWSVSECLTHLNVVDGIDADALTRAVIDARANGWTGNGPFRYGAVSAWFIRKLEPPVTMKTKAPKVYQPPPGLPRHTVIAEFERIHQRLIDILSMADGLDLARIKVPTPISKWIKFSFTPRVRLLAAHDRRHLWQAWQVRGASGFPPG
jgi:hypothetical protein